MRNFVIALPLPASFEITLPEKGTAWTLPGCSVTLTPSLQSKVEALEQIFEEHAPLETDERAAIQNHGRLFFIQGTLRTTEDFQSLNRALNSLLEQGALGVYMEHSGTAFSRNHFRELLENAPMEAWLNFVEKENYLYTLGMEAFGLADLRISLERGAEAARELLLAAAELIFTERLPVETGFRLELSEGEEIEFRKAAESLYRKTDFEYNRNGIWNLACPGA
ncbi:MAG: hypothetical protein LBR60_07625, partial [Fibrobacter sp.]|nr:hypothetical protein [Fibrobacter sp.]